MMIRWKILIFRNLESNISTLSSIMITIPQDDPRTDTQDQRSRKAFLQCKTDEWLLFCLSMMEWINGFSPVWNKSMFFSCLKWVNYFSPEWNEYMAFLTGECEHECIYEWLFFYVKKKIWMNGFSPVWVYMNGWLYVLTWINCPYPVYKFVR